MERIVLRHLSGSKANQVEEFPLAHFQELTIGRDPSATVKYDPDRDDLVGRQHAKIVRDSANPNEFLITDVGSRNGTFVNKQRIVGTAKVVPGDVVQFGAGGPEFQFDLEPRPANMIRPTRIGGDAAAATGGASAAPATRVGGGTAPYASAPAAFPATATASDGRVGKATVERMIGQKHSQSNKFMLIGGAALIAIIAIVAAALVYQNWSAKKELSSNLSDAEKKRLADEEARKSNAPMTVGEIAQKYSNAVVKIDESWKLIDTNTGGQVYHLYVPNEWTDKTDPAVPVKHPIVPDRRTQVAAFVDLGGGVYEPFLTDQGDHPIGGSGSGTGFTVTSDGFILTARHVGAGWNTRYQYTNDADVGVIVFRGPDNNWRFITDAQTGAPRYFRPPAESWVPSQTQQRGRLGLRYPVEGRHDFLNVTFPGNKTPFPAKVARVSDRHDVTLLKIDVPSSVPKVELNDTYDTTRAGDNITVLGYPGVSPIVYGVVKSQDVFNAATTYKELPDPSVTSGNIGRVIRSKEGSKDTEGSTFGDAYQLTANPGGGNSGGPVFDDRGGVIGIYYAGRSDGGGAQISFAVPIRYAMELITTTPPH
jgi:serine protease Do